MIKIIKLSYDQVHKIKTLNPSFEENKSFIFSLSLCNSNIDNDYDKFSDIAISEIGELFVGHMCKLYIPLHEDIDVQIFDTEIIYVGKQKILRGWFWGDIAFNSIKTIEQISALNNEAYVDFDYGIISSVCSICGEDKMWGCNHVKGEFYNNKLCYCEITKIIGVKNITYFLHVGPKHKKTNV